jgi:hypothetical protein
MNDTVEPVSLLPYLKTDRAKFYLELALDQQDYFAHQKPSFPFLVVSNSGPLSRIVEARINTDAETQIEPVFLLTQKDEYHLIKDELWPINNTTIDQHWQRALTFNTREKFGSPPLILRSQISKSGMLLPFQPLFFCKLKQVYFEPLCPDCGIPLQQCYKDGILKKYGLQPFNGSLKRYLFCPSCIDSKEKPDFYVSSLADNDPAFLKDRFELIKKFGQLKGNENLANLIPCIDCSRHQECYSPEGLVVSRIAPFSFYPFYMLVFKAGSVNALDFLSLMSGASIEELEDRLKEKQQPGRLNCLKVLKQKGFVETPLFYSNEDGHFLEILYLKLSFLGELAELIFSSLGTFQHPELGLSLERIWIKLSEQNNLLPSFWNFKLDLIDVIGVDTPSLSILKLPQLYGLHLLGAIWFYALVVNRKQDVTHVYSAIGDAIERISAQDESIFEKCLENGFPRVFAPENIFWNPEKITVNQKWCKLWKISLCLGINLLKGGQSGLIALSKEAFKQELEKLREQIKANLFSTEPSSLMKEDTEDDKPIADILINIMNTWQDGVKTYQGDLKATIPPTGSVYTKDDKTITDPQSGLEATIDQRKHRDSQSEPGHIKDDGMPPASRSGLDDTIDHKTSREFQPEIGHIRDDSMSPASQPGLDDTIDHRTFRDSQSTTIVPRHGEIHRDFPQDIDITETVILSPGDNVSKEIKGDKKDIDPNKTVLISSVDNTTTDKTEFAPQGNDHLKDTVRASAHASGKKTIPTFKPEDDLDTAHVRPVMPAEGDLPETVILPSRQNASKSGRAHFDPLFNNVGFDVLEKTDIPSDRTPTGVNKKTKTPDRHELLEDTIMIRPDKIDSKKKKDRK